MVRTGFGYHIIKVLEKHKSEDQTIRQIIFSTQFAAMKDRKLRPGLEAKARADLEAAAAEMKSGASWADVAKKYSDEATTKEDGGLLKPFREGM